MHQKICEKVGDVCGTIGINFMILKLLNLIDWSWWIVLLPFYGGFVLFASLFFILLIYFAIVSKIKGGKA